MTTSLSKRILLLTTNLGYGGSESDFIRLANFLARYVHVTVAVIASDYGSKEYTHEYLHLSLEPLILAKRSKLNLPIVSKLLKWIRLVRDVRRLKQQHSTTISFLSGANLLNALSVSPSRVVTSERGSKKYHLSLSPFTKIIWTRVLDPFIYSRSYFVVPASSDYAHEVREIAGSRDRSRVIPIDGSINSDSLLKAADSTPDADIAAFCQGTTIVYCGRLDTGKGVEQLLNVFAGIQHQAPRARLLIIGDGPCLSSLQQQCSVLNLSYSSALAESLPVDTSVSVYFAGYRRDPIRHFKLCQVYCFPSFHEGLSNALIEGVASGIPVVAADCFWGSRSILAGPDDCFEAVDRVQAPRQLQNGMLMPVLNSDKEIRLWQQVVHSLLVAKLSRLDLQQRKARIARFDIETTGHQWLALLK